MAPVSVVFHAALLEAVLQFLYPVPGALGTHQMGYGLLEGFGHCASCARPTELGQNTEPLKPQHQVGRFTLN